MSAIESGQMSTASPSNQPGWRRGRFGAYDQAVELQKLTLARLRSPDLDNSTFCSLIQAWDRIQERKRILRQVPKPAAVKVAAKQPRGIWHGKKAVQNGPNAGQNQPQAPGISPAPSLAAPGPVEPPK